MKLLRVGPKGQEKPAIIDNQNNYRDLSSLIDDFKPETLNIDSIKKIKNSDITKLPIISKDQRIGPCIKNPGKFVAIGLNYSDHAKETGLDAPKEPIVFMKAPSCITGPNDDIELVSYSKKLDWEVELGFIIGKETKKIEEKDAADHIFGYCIVNDLSEREWQIEKLGQWVKGKSADTFGPIGPYLVTKDEIADVQNLEMSLDLNGKRMQAGNTSKMIFKINFLLSYLSNFMSLYPGDIVTTGTPPGVGMGKKPPVYLKSGDEIKLSIDKLGNQFHKVKNEK